jgi:ubiquinone/menaquinone biosynthesis C-methylase UbiE
MASCSPASGFAIAEEKEQPQMSDIADHWATGDVFGRIVDALRQAGKSTAGLTVEDLSPIDHYHARGRAATVELADMLDIRPEHRILDIGCGVGGPARYVAARFGCRVVGIDIAQPFVAAAEGLTRLVGMASQVTFVQGDGQRLPQQDAEFDGAFTQHVTMNVADRAGFFREAFRVLKPGGFFALTEHGLGPVGEPHFPAPWSEDGSFSFLCTPSQTRALLEAAGFEDVAVAQTGAKYLAAYKAGMAMVKEKGLPPLGVHVLVGPSVGERTRNAARNIEENRTQPVLVTCRKPA